MTVGERIKKYRLAAGLTQLDVANAIGTTKQAIYKYENNIVTNIPIDKITALADIFGISPIELSGWDEKEKPADNVSEPIDTITQDFVEILNKLTPEQKRALYDSIRALLPKEE